MGLLACWNGRSCKEEGRRGSRRSSSSLDLAPPCTRPRAACPAPPPLPHRTHRPTVLGFPLDGSPSRLQYLVGWVIMEPLTWHGGHCHCCEIRDSALIAMPPLNALERLRVNCTFWPLIATVLACPLEGEKKRYLAEKMVSRSSPYDLECGKSVMADGRVDLESGKHFARAD